MRQEAAENGGSRELFAALRKTVPFEVDATSENQGWAALEAVRYRAAPPSELHQHGLAHHGLHLFVRPPEKLDLEYEGVKRHVPPSPGSILLIPAGSPTQIRWTGRFDCNVVYLEPELIAKVAAEAFDLDPARLTVPPLDAQNLPHLRALMMAVDTELTAGAGGPLAAESLANVLAVNLVRHILAPRRPERGRDGTLPRRRLRAVVEFIEGNLDASPTLEQMAAVANLNPHYFARQFKAETGLPPHQYVIARRVERAKELLQEGGAVSLTQVATKVGFSDHSHFCRHFKRIVGVTPGQFRTPAKSP